MLAINYLIRTAVILLIVLYFSGCEKEEKYTPKDIIDSTGLMGMMNSSWPCDGYNSRRSSQSPFNGPDVCQVLWTYNTRPGIHLSDAISPVIDDEGNLYSMAWTRMVKLTPEGNLQWEIELGYYLRTMPTIGSDGTLYATGMYQNSVTGFTQGGVFAIDPYGNENWEFNTDDNQRGGATGAAAIAPDGTIYITDWGHYLYALSPRGKVRWKYKTTGRTASSPAIMADGTIIIVDYQNVVFAIHPDGSLKWQRQLQCDIGYDMALDKNGTIYFSSENGIVALTSDGDDLWDFVVVGGVWYRPALDDNGTVVFGGDDGYVYALHPDGTEKWKYKTGGAIGVTPTLDARGHVYVGSRDGYLYALTNTGEFKWNYELHSGYGQPTLAANGTLYVGTCDGLIVAIGEGK